LQIIGVIMFETIRSWRNRTFPRFDTPSQELIKTKVKFPKVKPIPMTIEQAGRQAINDAFFDEVVSQERLDYERDREIRIARRTKENAVYAFRRSLPSGIDCSAAERIYDLSLQESMHSEFVRLLNMANSNEKLSLSHYFNEDKMIRVTGHDEIIEALKDLRVGQIGCIRFLQGRSSCPHNDSDYRFRRFMRFDDGTSKVGNRDSHNRLFDASREFYDSCFHSSNDNLYENIEAMYRHDNDHGYLMFHAQELIIIDTLDNLENDAWLYLQDEIMYTGRLELNECRIYKETIKKEIVDEEKYA